MEIALRARDGSVRAHTLIDDNDCELLGIPRGKRWCLHSTGYAYSFVDSRPAFMHRIILGLSRGDGLMADHINGNPLDNRRNNLRIVTPAQNVQNRSTTTAKSGERNVYWHKPSGLWKAEVRCGGVSKTRYFKNKMDAVAVARELRREMLPFSVQ